MEPQNFKATFMLLLSAFVFGAISFVNLKYVESLGGHSTSQVD